MKQKNKLNAFLLLFVLMLSVFLLAGCNSSPKLSETAQNINSNLSISGIQLAMEEKAVFELIGDNFEKSPCIIGYEYAYDDLNLNLGIDIDTLCVKRITFKNPLYSVYSMPIGIKCSEGGKILSANGFVNDGESKYKFIKEDTRVTMVSIDGEVADGFVVELIS